MKNSNKITVH